MSKYDNKSSRLVSAGHALACTGLKIELNIEIMDCTSDMTGMKRVRNVRNNTQTLAQALTKHRTWSPGGSCPQSMKTSDLS